MVFRWDPIFIGDSYIMSPEIPCPAGERIDIYFRYYEDWWSDTVVVGSAITSDNGNTWTSIWELHATGNVGPDYFNTSISAPGNFRLGFYYKGDSNNIDFLFTDFILIGTMLTPSYPPSFLYVQASSTEQKVILNWNIGSAVDPIIGYLIQRKNGLPEDNSPYITIEETNENTFTYDDETINVNQIYTYRISTLSGFGTSSHFGNEATAYVSANVPVELISFTANSINNRVELSWQTATESNNSGFEILRSAQNDNSGWGRIGFVPGAGTTTEPNIYLFIDENVSSGVYQYRLKQIDFDGSFTYSNIVSIEINTPVEFSLEQNYPNPFNPSTKIKFTIPVTLSEVEGSLVTLIVYDVLGSEVATLVNEEKSAGNYELEFDASGLPSGIYFYQLQAQELIQTKKMLLLK